MHEDRSAGTAHLAASVRGLGVCDVLRVELAACQHVALQDALAARAAALERQLGALQTRVTERGRSRPRARCVDAPPSPDAVELAALRAEARTLERVRAGVPVHAAGPFTLLAPAGVALELVSACLRAAVVTVAASLDDPRRQAARTVELEAAAAWIATTLDCRAVEAFCLEPGVDPLHAT